jgi:hypothetical protein
MAYSTSGDYNATATDIITEALEILGVLEEGEAPSAAQSTSALRSLNYLIKNWSADTQIWAQAEYQLDLVAGTNSYTLDVLNVGYTPQKLLSATRINTTTFDEATVNLITQGEWYDLSDKTTEGTVVNIFAQRLLEPDGMTINVWPTPADTTFDLKLWLQYPYRDVDAGTDDVWFTQEWFLPLSYGLAFILAPKYGISESEKQGLFEGMTEFKWEAESFQTDGSLYFQPNRDMG